MALALCALFLLSLAGTAFASVGGVSNAYGYVIAKTSLNVHSGPNSSYKSVGRMAENEKASVTGYAATGWYQININGMTAYVNAAYVDASNVVTDAGTKIPTPTTAPVLPVVPAYPTVPTVPTVPTTTVSGTQMYVNASTLNVRAGAGTKYGVVGQLNRGQVVTVTGKSGNWSQIALSNGYGYVYTKYLSSYGTVPSAPSSNVYASGNYLYVTTGVNIRSGAGTNFAIVGYVPKGTIVRRLSTSGDYTQIQVSNGSRYSAYVHSAYLIEYNYADAASRVSYPTCYLDSGYYGGYGYMYPYSYGVGYDFCRYGNCRYSCTQCGRMSPTTACPYCGGNAKYYTQPTKVKCPGSHGNATVYVECNTKCTVCNTTVTCPGYYRNNCTYPCYP